MSTAAQPGTAGDEGYDDASVGEPGWAMFAAILLFLAGTWNVIDGVLAMSRSHVYTADAHYVFSDLKHVGLDRRAARASSSSARAWGCSAAAVGPSGLRSQSTVVNAIGQLMFVPAYPFWALAMFTLDVLIIFGLVIVPQHDQALKA